MSVEVVAEPWSRHRVFCEAQIDVEGDSTGEETGQVRFGLQVTLLGTTTE